MNTAVIRPAPLDQSAIDALNDMSVAGEDDFVKTVVSMFLDTTPAALDTLVQSAASGDLKSIGRISHNLKSSSAVLGAVALAAVCAEVEAQARFGTVQDAVDLVRQTVDEYERVRPELLRLLRSASS